MREEHEIGRDAFTDDREYRLHALRHSAAHLLAHAVSELFPEARFAIGPAVKDGFYYDIAYPRPFTPEDLAALEVRMREIVKRDLPLVRGQMSHGEAETFFAGKGQNFKVELVRSFPEGEPVGTYTQGEYIDLCRGPHIDRTGKLKHTKLLSVAGAYWRGDAKNEQLQRIYGTAFPTAEELKLHLERIELAKARDHRKLGRELGLFMFHEWAPGAAFWLPKGTTLYNILAGKMRDLLLAEGYVEVKTPLIFDKELWVTSGHWDHYKEDIFLVPEKNDFLLQAAGEKDAPETPAEQSRLMAVKPMNCPSHMLIFKSQKRSYRELPLRLHDQGVLHRNELSGALSGLTRVRQFSQDDAHVFLPEAEIGAEVGRLIALVKRVYDKLGMGVQVALATRPDKFLGTVETWDRAEAALKEAITSNGFPLKLKPKDGTFYGPKIDYQVVDALGRQFQTATLQLDFQLPQRFDLKYTGSDNEEHRPVVIHRAIYGSFERFIAILLEHFGGVLPFWLSPVQIKVLTVGEQFTEYGREVAAAFTSAGLRVEVDLSDGTVGAKVRNAQMEKIPYSIVLGERERESRSVTVRAYSRQEQIPLSLEAAVARFSEEARFAF
ncbi:MAG TPA: threonine--tRNA ligase [Polyangia bacterium]|nr:threonine--tRNA ligase [Polyangia bacterium]